MFCLVWLLGYLVVVGFFSDVMFCVGLLCCTLSIFVCMIFRFWVLFGVRFSVFGCGCCVFVMWLGFGFWSVLWLSVFCGVVWFWLSFDLRHVGFVVVEL